MDHRLRACWLLPPPASACYYCLGVRFIGQHAIPYTYPWLDWCPFSVRPVILGPNHLLSSPLNVLQHVEWCACGAEPPQNTMLIGAPWLTVSLRIVTSNCGRQNLKGESIGLSNYICELAYLGGDPFKDLWENTKQAILLYCCIYS